MSSRHKHARLECGELLVQISDYLDGDLEDAICLELENHLVNCTDCQIVTDTLRKTISLYRRRGRVELPDGLTERLWQALEAGGCTLPGR